MNTALFPDLPESLSPKLAWLKKHNLQTFYDAEAEGESPETGEQIWPWICWKLVDGDPVDVREPYGTGQTEEDAILNYCEKTGTPHYSLQ